MKLFIVENDLQRILSFLEAAVTMGWGYYQFPLGKEIGADDESIRRFLNEVCKERPDVVVLDAALTSEEEKILGNLEVMAENVPESSLSGFKFCRALASEKTGIPIVFLTRSGTGPVARTAMRVGANRVLIKADKVDNLIGDIEELLKSNTPHDSAFYWSTRQSFDVFSDMWQADVLRKALDSFYLNISSIRRFSRFTANFKGILSTLFQGSDDKAEKTLMLSLVKSQMLLSLVDPRLRDHVKHTGNVFWLGYRLLHDIQEYKTPLSLEGAIKALYEQPGLLTPRDQLMHSWTLAALFHDFGYVDERQHQLTGLITSLVPGIKVTTPEIRAENSWHENMKLLQNFVTDLLGTNHFLVHYIREVISKFDSSLNGTLLIDHGFISAHRLLTLIPIKDLDDQKKKVVLHAAIAIAYHNYAEIFEKWNLSPECKGTLNIGTLPICSLLAFCDNTQTWDRESEVDPTLSRTESSNGLLDRLVLTNTSYISGSEICEFSTKYSDDDKIYVVEIKIRYFVEDGANIEEVCNAHHQDIKRWIDTGKLSKLCNLTGMSSLLKGELVYELPMLFGNRSVTF